ITLFARYNNAPSYSEFGSWQVNQLSLKSESMTLGMNARITANIVQDFRANTTYTSAESLWRQANGTLLPDCYLSPLTKALTLNQTVCESFFRFSIAGIGQLVSGRESETRQRQWNLVDTLTVNWRSHQLRFGADYRRLAPTRSSPGVSVSLLSEGIGDLLANRNLWLSISKTENASSLLEEVSAFAQDSWHVNGRLSLNFGARWELNPPPTSTNPVFGLKNGSQLFGPIAETAIWPIRYSNIAPRFGLAYRPTRGGTVIRAGAGLFYDSSLSVATDLVNGGPLSVSQFSNPASQGGALATLILSYGFLPNLRLPEIWQWNVSVERTFAGRDAVSMGYVGSRGDMLLRREMGGPGTSEILRLVLATNHGASDYHALQLQYRRRMARGLHATASYSWSHSIDTDSADPSVNWTGSGLNASRDRGSSDFDVRQSFNGSFTYTPPGKLSGWSVDGIVRARSGFPINVLNTEYTNGVSLANVYRPDLAWGQPVWLTDRSAPNGKRLNQAAFGPRSGTQGGLGRNAIRGFGMMQTDLAVG
ncbi:MAG: TonB-dependent receptor, partial [Bryobacteraceae bacterium]